MSKTRRTESEFYHLLSILRKRIHLIPLEELAAYVGKAEKLCPDPDDVVYFALALKLHCPFWSNDKKLKEQESVIVYSTGELDKLV